ncbi:glycoside hydrolase superfamily [Crassisporium funariophilum]|nr:glycoside hydrolase superfamily [Crassisporium funariophilum]
MRVLDLLLLHALITVGVRGTNHFQGIVASNSMSGSSTYTCRSQQQWNSMANDAKSSGFKSIRITGFDCDALDKASSAAAAADLTVLAGIYYAGTVASSESSIDNDVDTFKKAYKKYGQGRYLGLSVGNEVNDSANNIIDKVNQVRSVLRAAGVNTPISTVHTWTTIRDHPTLCQADFVGANAHAFYDEKTTAENTGNFVFKTVVPALKNACPGRKIIIAESGWPSRGSANGVATASVSNERSALLNLNCACRDDTSVSVFAFEYDDQNWKSDDIERSFGMFGKIKLNGDTLAAC